MLLNKGFSRVLQLARSALAICSALRHTAHIPTSTGNLIDNLGPCTDPVPIWWGTDSGQTADQGQTGGWAGHQLTAGHQGALLLVLLLQHPHSAPPRVEVQWCKVVCSGLLFYFYSLPPLHLYSSAQVFALPTSPILLTILSS